MRRRLLIWGGVVIALIVGLALAIPRAIAPPARLFSAVPAELTTRATIPGVPGARYFVGIDLDPLVGDVIAARKREQAYLAQSGHEGELPPPDLLAISGGGDKGAFGAGLLVGWTANGTRPTFKAVTGVSTGSLIAPFAFLGAEYDDVLKQTYTSVTPNDIALPRMVLAAIDNDGMADNRPLWALISKYVDQKLLERIAHEYAKGRLLLVGTTDLDARQPVIWNMGAIASAGTPEALELFREILLASAAIPGAFPPSMIRVDVDGKPHQEMHVDGGASAQVFLYPPGLKRAAAELGLQMSRKGRVYVIRNSSITASGDPVQRQTINIAARAIDSLIHTQGLGDLFRIYLTTQHDGFDFNLAFIGPDFVYPKKKQQFENAYMVKLYNYGYDLGRAGYPWRKSPPGFDETVSGAATGEAAADAAATATDSTITTPARR